MNFLKKGPDLKLSGIKVPGFLQDIYYDLKDRHLLPVAAILMVAIVAVPIVLAKSGSEEAETAPPAEAGAASSSAAGQPGELVAKSAPGLRDYRRRLDHRQAKNPFEQHHTGSSSSAEDETSGGSQGVSGEPPSEPSTTEPPPETQGGGGEGTPVPGELTYYSYAIDVRVSGGSQEGDRKLTVRRDLPELTMLPSRETPAIVYLGSTKDGKKAVMMVSSDVKAIFGDAKCALGSERCELLIMEPGLPETFVYGGAGRTYKIELLKIHLVESDKLNRAPLGKPKKKGSGGSG
jgi:hypothetical protein